MISVYVDLMFKMLKYTPPLLAQGTDGSTDSTTTDRITSHSHDSDQASPPLLKSDSHMFA